MFINFCIARPKYRFILCTPGLTVVIKRICYVMLCLLLAPHRRRARVQSASKPIHTATSDTTKLSCLFRVRFGGIPDNSRLSPTKKFEMFEHVQSNRPIHTGTPDTTQTGPSCRVCCGGVN